MNIDMLMNQADKLSTHQLTLLIEDAICRAESNIDPCNSYINHQLLIAKTCVDEIRKRAGENNEIQKNI